MAMQPVQADQVKPRWRADGVWRLLALTPFALSLLTPVYFPAMFAKPPEILGIPVGLVLDVIALGWAGLGAIVVWTTTSRVMASIALVTTTAPTIVVLVFSPAIVLILQNLG